MSVKNTLKFHQRFAHGGQADSISSNEPSSESLLSQHADRFLADHEQREAHRMAEAEYRAANAGKGAIVSAVQRYEQRAASTDWTDDSVPALTRFDAYTAVKDASYADPTDRGIKQASYSLYKAWSDDVSGALSLRDLRDLKSRTAKEYPKSRLASVLDASLATNGFNTLKNLPKLARIASEIESQEDYNSAMVGNGLDGPENIRARAFIRALLEMDPEEVSPKKATMYDRILARIGVGDDPTFNLAGQLDGPSENEGDIGGDGDGQGGSVSEAGMPEHDEAHETHVEIESPISGEMLVLELGSEDVGAESIDGMTPEHAMPPVATGGPSAPMGDGHQMGARRHGQKQETGAHGWPLVPSKHFPGEKTLACPECGSTDVMLTTQYGSPGTGPGGRGRLGDPGSKDVAICQNCKHRSASLLTNVNHIASMEYIGQLSEMMGPGPEVDGAPANELDPNPMDAAAGETTAIVMDPTSGEQLEVSLRPVSDSEDMMSGPGAGMQKEAPESDMMEHGAAAGDDKRCSDCDKSMKECACSDGKMASRRHVAKIVRSGNEWLVKTEDGSKTLGHHQSKEDAVKQLQAIEISKHKGSVNKTFEVFATVDGETSDEPLDHFTATSMTAALQRLAQFGVDGHVMADPKNPNRSAMVVLDADKGDWLHVIAADDASHRDPYNVKPNAQQPDQVSVPEDGAEALASDGGFKQDRAMKKPKKAMSRDEVVSTADNMGLSAAAIESRLLNGDVLSQNGWTLQIDAADQILFGKTSSKSKRIASILDLDNVIADFQAAIVNNMPTADDHIHTATLFKARCASCRGVNEYVMPKTAMPLTCASCDHVTSVATLQRAFERQSAKGVNTATSDYLITVTVPAGASDRDFAINTKRVEAEVKKVVATSEVSADSALRVAEIVVRAADESAIRRIERVLSDVFGMTPSVTATKSAQYVGQTPATQAQPGVDDPSMKHEMQVVDTQPGAQREKLQNALNPLQKGKMGPVVAGNEDGNDMEIEANDEEMLYTAQMLMMADEPEMPHGMNDGDMDSPPSHPMSMDDDMGGDMGGMNGEMSSDTGDNVLPFPSPLGGNVLDAEGRDAAHAALLHYRNQGMGVLDALAEFHREYGDYLEGFGDDASPERHLAEAEVVKVAGEVYSAPALIQRAAHMVENAMRMFADVFEPKINTQQPDATAKQKLDADTDGKEPGFGPAGKPKSQQGPMQGSGHPDPNLGADTSQKDPFKTPSVSNTGQSGSQHTQPGTSYADTNLGSDSDTKEAFPTPAVSSPSRGKSK